MATAACVVRPAVVRISGMGEALPGHILSSAALEARLHLEEGWIVRRTGIVSRHLLGDDEPLCELAASAVRAACDDAGCAPEDLDAIIATATCPDASLPSLASRVASLLAVDPPSVFDVAASSAGFLAGLAVAEGFIARGRARRVALVAAEALSRCVDWEDRETCVLFGDGCAAAILEPAIREPSLSQTVSVAVSTVAPVRSWALRDLVLASDRGGIDALRVAPARAGQPVPPLEMHGRVVFLSAVRRMAEALKGICARNDIDLASLDVIVAHQANARILEALARRLNLSTERLPGTIAEIGNVGAASLPLALLEARRRGRLGPGKVGAIVAFGAGFVWGAGLIDG